MAVRMLGVALFFLAACGLGIAWYVEHALHFAPCNLCLMERVPWRIVAGLGLVAAIVVPRIGRFAVWLAIPTLLINSVLSVIHVGVEQHWWQSPFPACRAPHFGSGSYEEHMLSLPLRPMMPCDSPTYILHLPLSMAALNLIACLGLSVIVYLALKTIAKKGFHRAKSRGAFVSQRRN